MVTAVLQVAEVATGRAELAAGSDEVAVGSAEIPNIERVGFDERVVAAEHLELEAELATEV